MFEDPNQIEVPPSFMALYTTPGGHRLTEPLPTVRERYELCEDLAQMLTERASTEAFKSGGSEREVLVRMQAALSGGQAGLRDDETVWVVTRLAELLGWEMPDPASSG
jgi:hypothetical protein